MEQAKNHHATNREQVKGIKKTVSLWLLGLLAAAVVGCRSTPPPPLSYAEFAPGVFVPQPQLMAGQPLFTNQSPLTNLFVPLPPFLQLPEQKAFREEVERSGASPALVEKMLQGGPLTLEEIRELSQKQVGATNIIKYLRTTGASYTLTSQQIDELRAAAVSREVIDYLLTTPALRSRVFYYPAYPYYPRYLWWDHHHYDFHYDFHHGWHH